MTHPLMSKTKMWDRVLKMNPWERILLKIYWFQGVVSKFYISHLHESMAIIVSPVATYYKRKSPGHHNPDPLAAPLCSHFSQQLFKDARLKVGSKSYWERVEALREAVDLDI